MSLGIQPLDDAYLTGIFDELAKLEVQLDSDPLIYGPKRLNQKTALIRKMTTQCERMFLDAAQKHAQYKRSQRAADLILDMSMKHLLANDPETRAGRAVSEREAIASGKLKTEVQEVAAAKQAIEDLEAVISVIKAKRSDLRDIQGRLRDQMRLCQEEIGLGNRWGSKNPRGVELQPGQGYADGTDTSAIDDVIAAVRQAGDAEMHLKAEVDHTDTEAEEVATLLVAADEDEADDTILMAFGDDDDDEEDDKPAPQIKHVHVPMPQTKPVPVPAKAPEPKVVDNLFDAATSAAKLLMAEFGFIPHCEVCGEPQFQSPRSGITCPNGHGGAESVRPGDNLFEAATSAVASDVLPGTSDQEEVTQFLAGALEPLPAPKKTRFQIEEEDGMDLDSILANF